MDKHNFYQEIIFLADLSQAEKLSEFDEDFFNNKKLSEILDTAIKNYYLKLDEIKRENIFQHFMVINSNTHFDEFEFNPLHSIPPKPMRIFVLDNLLNLMKIFIDSKPKEVDFIFFINKYLEDSPKFLNLDEIYEIHVKIFYDKYISIINNENHSNLKK